MVPESQLANIKVGKNCVRLLAFTFITVLGYILSTSMSQGKREEVMNKRREGQEKRGRESKREGQRLGDLSRRANLGYRKSFEILKFIPSDIFYPFPKGSINWGSSIQIYAYRALSSLITTPHLLSEPLLISPIPRIFFMFALQSSLVSLHLKVTFLQHWHKRP